MPSPRAILALALFILSYALTRADPTTLPPPGQPSRTGTANSFQVIGTSGVSAQQLFLGTLNTVYVLDKTENNQMQVNGHPAWGSEITLNQYAIRPMDVYSNSFCAGGASLGDGRWINVGGNQGITWGGLVPAAQTTPSPYGGTPYDDYDGGSAIRLLTPCDDGTCNWIDKPANYMSSRRWYPTVEPLEDGSVIIIGGDTIGGYVNSNDQNNPTLEFWPSRGGTVQLPILDETLPANLFPLTWLLPSGNLFIQVNWAAEIYNYKTNVEHRIADIPAAVRTYPASGASVLLPLTPANNYTATVLFCGGSNVSPEQWTSGWDIPTYPASTNCVRINPDDPNPTWKNDTILPEARTMGNFILLPDGRIFLVNGGQLGTAGYGNDSFAIGHSYADDPDFTPLIYDPSPGIPTSQRLSRVGLGSSTVPRLYHSTALLLPDGSVMVSGSNPNPDVTLGKGVKYPTEYRVELFYPWYFNYTRPNPSGLINQLGYGGDYFDVQLNSSDLQVNNEGNGPLFSLNGTKAILIRTGFSTHSINMGQRYLQLQTSYTLNPDGSGILHVSQLPCQPTLFPPGPAVLYITVNGVPSVGVLVMVGNGQIGNQTLNAITPLPNDDIVPTSSASSYASSPTHSGSEHKGAAALGMNVPSVMGLSVSIAMVLMGAFLGSMT